MRGMHVAKPPTWSKQQLLPALKPSLHHILSESDDNIISYMDAIIVHCRYTHIDPFLVWNSAKVLFYCINLLPEAMNLN